MSAAALPMRVLLGSGGFRTPERVERVRAALAGHFAGAHRVLFIPYALADHPGYLRAVRERGLDAGIAITGIHEHADPIAAAREADGFYVGGGNTFRLLRDLQRGGLLDVIRDRVLAGVPYYGVSAGCNVACPTIMTTNDMPITRPESLGALGLVPFQVNPHYFEGAVHVLEDDEFVAHFGETRDQRIAEFHEENATPVLGLWEGGLLRREGASLSLLDGTPARLFRRGEAPVDYAPGADLSFLL